ncbi:MAG: hypothetical protein QW478_14190 [Candidatus Micrarchaeaceae archaeon]
MNNSINQKEYEIDFERIKELISRYEQIKQSGEILPLFEALWSVTGQTKTAL